MFPVPSTLRIQFEACLHTRNIPNAERGAYMKWTKPQLIAMYHPFMSPPPRLETRAADNARYEPSRSSDSYSERSKISKGASWVDEYAKMALEIKLRHYSPKTLKSYMQWMRQFQTFSRSKDPHLLSSEDVKEFLTFPAVTKQVAASTQNQAFNAFLFFYRHVLKRELLGHSDVSTTMIHTHTAKSSTIKESKSPLDF